MPPLSHLALKVVTLVYVDIEVELSVQAEEGDTVTSR